MALVLPASFRRGSEMATLSMLECPTWRSSAIRVGRKVRMAEEPVSDWRYWQSSSIPKMQVQLPKWGFNFC